MIETRYGTYHLYEKGDLNYSRKSNGEYLITDKLMRLIYPKKEKNTLLFKLL